MGHFGKPSYPDQYNLVVFNKELLGARYMKRHHILVKTAHFFIVTILFSSPVFAIDLNYNPELDAPTENGTGTQQVQTDIKKRLPGERNSNDTIHSQPLLLNDIRQNQQAESDNGWTVKAPSISSDKEPSATDERQSVKMSEQQRWQEDGKNYDNNPLNKDNYRVNVEAEYTF